MRLTMKFLTYILLVAISLNLFVSPFHAQQEIKTSANNKSQKFIETANARIEKTLYEEKLANWRELEELQELESLRQSARQRPLTVRESLRFSELKQKREGILGTQNVSNISDEKALKFLIDSKVTESYLGLYSEWKKHPSPELEAQLAGSINLLALRKDITSKVKIGSITPGATIKYQTLFERSKSLEPMTAKQPTSSSEQMPIGYYYIWAERNRKATSDKSAKFHIAAEDEEVKIDEN